jgi:putative addiction module component (TIGR02574 family)
MEATLQSLGIDQMTPDERLALIEAIWDSLAADADNLPIPAWHKEELDRRLAAHQDNPRAGSSWEDVKARLVPGIRATTRP